MQKTLDTFQLLEINYKKLISTVVKSDTLFSSVNSKLSELDTSLKIYNENISSEPPKKREITEQDIKNYIENERSEFRNITDFVAKVAIGVMIERYMEALGAAAGTFVLPGGGTVAGGVVGGLFGVVTGLLAGKVYDELLVNLPVRMELDERYNSEYYKSLYKFPRLPIVQDQGKQFEWPYPLMDQKTYNSEVQKYISKNKGEAPAALGPTAKNQQQKVRKRKTKTYAVSQDNFSYFTEFMKEYQAFMDLIKQKMVEADTIKKITEKSVISSGGLDALSKKIQSEVTGDYVTPGRRYSIPSDEYYIPNLKGKNAYFDTYRD